MLERLLGIRFRNVSNRALPHAAFTYGVPVAPGVLTGTDSLAIELPGGALRPIQSRPTEHHRDGSIRWLLLDFDMPVEANQAGECFLVRGAGTGDDGDLVVSEDDDRVEVANSHIRAAFSRRSFSVLESLVIEGREMMASGSDVVVEMLNGKRFHASLSGAVDVRVIEHGCQRVVVEVAGRHTAEDDSALLLFRFRYTILRHDSCVKLAYKFTNCSDPETGVEVASISIAVPTSLGGRTTKHIRQRTHGANWWPRAVDIRENVELFCAGAVNQAAANRYGAAAEGKVLIRNFESLREDLSEYPHFLRPGNARTDMAGGLRQTYPYLGVNGAGGSLVGWFSEMENNYPKAVRCERNVMAFDIWPASAGPLRVRRGMSKEHDLFLSFAAAERALPEMEGAFFDHEIYEASAWSFTGAPVQLTLDPEYVRSCEVFDLHRWLRHDPARYTPIEMKLGSAGATHKVASKGMLDIGDSVSADRSWCRNNENDDILDLMRDYYRRGEFSARYAALLTARHNAHVDFIAWDPDPLRQGTMPAHCPEHTDGATYPSHMWVGGLLAAYHTCGEPDFRAAALSVGENMLRWQRQRTDIFYADSRECGWPMLAYVQLFDHTHEQRWLDAAGEVFEFYRSQMDENAEILYARPHNMDVFLTPYGEFATWRGCFHYYERTGRQDVKDFLVRCLSLPQVYLCTPARYANIGWGCNDLFPAWAAWELTRDDRFIEDNYPFIRFLMNTAGQFAWKGVDIQYYLAELDRRDKLAEFCG